MFATPRVKEDEDSGREKGLSVSPSVLLGFLPNHTSPSLNYAQQQLQPPPSPPSSSTLLFLHLSFPTVLNNLSSHIKLKTGSHRCRRRLSFSFRTNFKYMESIFKGIFTVGDRGLMDGNCKGSCTTTPGLRFLTEVSVHHVYVVWL